MSVSYTHLDVYKRQQPVPYEIDSHKGMDMGHSHHEHSDASSGATRK